MEDDLLEYLIVTGEIDEFIEEPKKEENKKEKNENDEDNERDK